MVALMAGVVCVGFALVDEEGLVLVDVISDEEDSFELEAEDERRVEDVDLDGLVKVDRVELDDALEADEAEEINDDEVDNFVDEELKTESLLEVELVFKIFWFVPFLI